MLLKKCALGRDATKGAVRLLAVGEGHVEKAQKIFKPTSILLRLFRNDP